jgi:hypothetical protein
MGQVALVSRMDDMDVHLFVVPANSKAWAKAWVKAFRRPDGSFAEYPPVGLMATTRYSSCKMKKELDRCFGLTMVRCSNHDQRRRIIPRFVC